MLDERTGTAGREGDAAARPPSAAAARPTVGERPEHDGVAREPPPPPGRRATARLGFAPGGGRTVLVRQHVPYPSHVTRCFRLDAARPGLATLYLQSASGGLYRGDDIGLVLSVDAGGEAHVTTQAATVVHDCRGERARQRTHLTIGPGGVAAFTPDPAVLFPGAAQASETEVTLAPGAMAILTEGACRHDPAGGDAPFARYDAATTVRDADGRVLIAERGWVHGQDLAGDAGATADRQTYRAASPLGPWRAFGTCLLLGPADRLPDPATVEAAATLPGCLAGASAAPNGAGLAIRLVAADGGALARAMTTVFASGFTAMLGSPPARRRK